MTDLKTNLKSKFRDKEYAHAYIQSHVVTRIASQLLVLRKNKNWTQKQLAEAASISQEKISKYENADFSSLTFRTLYKLAEAFDVSLQVIFTEFSKSIEDIEAYSEDILKVVDRVADLESFTYAVPVVSESEPEYSEYLAKNRPAFKVQTSYEVLRDINAGETGALYISLVRDDPTLEFHNPYKTLPAEMAGSVIISNFNTRKISYG
jgi:transcriptional regulator with XRE-family HTH domain